MTVMLIQAVTYRIISKCIEFLGIDERELILLLIHIIEEFLLISLKISNIKKGKLMLYIDII